MKSKIFCFGFEFEEQKKSAASLTVDMGDMGGGGGIIDSHFQI
jgi:hypothetical protein